MYDENDPLVIKAILNHSWWKKYKINRELLHYISMEPTSNLKFINSTLMQVYTAYLYFKSPFYTGDSTYINKQAINIWLPVKTESD